MVASDWLSGRQKKDPLQTGLSNQLSVVGLYPIAGNIHTFKLTGLDWGKKKLTELFHAQDEGTTVKLLIVGDCKFKVNSEFLPRL